MKTDRVEVEGTRVVINADSEHTARAVAAAADRLVIGSEGTKAEGLDRLFDSIGELSDSLSRPAMGIAGWVLGLVAAWLTAISFASLAPRPELAWLFGAVGVVFILVIKLGAARWAKADNLNAPHLANFYRWMVFGGMAIVLIAGTAFQAAVSKDQSTGVTDIETRADHEDGEIKKLEFAAREMTRPEDPVADLEADIARVLAGPAKTKSKEKGKPDELAGMTIGEAVGHGVRNAEHQPAQTFCVPSGQNDYFIERYCDDLIDMEKGVRQRVRYESAIADIATRKAANEILRASAPEKASGLVLAEAVAGDQSQLFGFLGSALLLAIVEMFMAFCTYVSKRHPKGVTAALAALSQAPGLPPSANQLLQGQLVQGRGA